MRRRLRLVAALVLLGLAGGAGAWWLAIRRADRFLDQVALLPGGTAGELEVAIAAPVALDRAPPAGVRCITSTDDIRDGGALAGRLFAATSGGLYAIGPGRRPERPYTHLDGLSGIDLTAVAPLGDRLVVGDATGGLTLIDGEHAVAVRTKRARTGAVADLAPAGDVVYALHTGVGVIAFDGRRAIDVGAAAKVDLREASALCAGPAGLAVGTRGGELYLERDAALQKTEVGLAVEPITALACDGGDLVVGTPFGLHRVTALRARRLAADLFVTSLLATPGALHVATFDDGVRVLDPETGRERGRHLPGQRVHRLRDLGGRITAFGPGGPWAFTGGHFEPQAAPPRGLAGPHVTALARDGGGALWVGTFEHGIDVLSADLVPQRHLPARGAAGSDARDDQVNALAFRPATREMLAATVHGVDVYGPDGAHRLPLGEAPGAVPDAIAALAFTPGGGLALAGNRGLSLVDGARVRSLYAFHGLANNHVYAVASDGDRIYAGTLGGLSIIEDAKVKRSLGAGPGALRAAWVTALAVTPEGLYIGSYGGGVQLLRARGPAEDVSGASGRFHVNPGALAVDGNTLWVGTLEAGLLAFDRTAHAWRRLDRLLPSDNVTALLPDGDALLVGTTSGLIRLPRAVLEDALAPVRRPVSHPEGSS
ncbi:MAG: hypothetical protein EXR72_04620 [Myxococcales bacterium]|nr:hypothetical protein [Myxococcales bacterium]